MVSLIALLPLLLQAGGASAQRYTQETSYPSPWGSGGPGWDEAYTKAREFVSQLTLPEKVNLTTGTGHQGDLCVGNTGSVPRLGFRHFCLQNGPNGVGSTDGNSVFPSGLTAVATFSRDLLRRRGYAMGEEHSGKGVDVQLGPNVGALGRDPAGGRNWEGFSPDPYLSGLAVAETVIGTQDAGVIANAKHFILNEQEHFRNSISSNLDDKSMHELYLWPFADAVRAGVGSIMCSYNRINGTYACENSKTLNYLLKNELSFQGFVVSDWAAQHSGVNSALAGLDMTMPGSGSNEPYNSYWGGALTEAVLNGTVPQWRLDDMVVRIMAAYYKVGRDKTRIPINFSTWVNTTTGYRHFAAGRDNTTVNYHVNVQGDHAELIREIAAKGTVLLKNENSALPLTKPLSIAVIGEDAQSDPNGPNACLHKYCTAGTLAVGWGSGAADFPYLIAPADALKKQAEADGTAFTNVESNWDLDAARAAARDAWVAVVFVNANSGTGTVLTNGNFGDRGNLTLDNGGDNLIAAVASVNSNTVVVIHSVGPVLMDHFKTHPNVTAILWAGLPGQESGNSITDVLYGKVNPQGRTPFTWGKAQSDWGITTLIESDDEMPETDFDEGVFIDYRHFDKKGIEPSWEFGFGLSYTNFTYSDLNIKAAGAPDYEPAMGETSPAPTFGKVDKNPASAMPPPDFERLPKFIYSWINDTDIPCCGTPNLPEGSRDVSAQPLLAASGAPGGNPGLYETVFTVTASVENTGPLQGAEIPQLYLSLGGPDEPKAVLRGFEEVSLEPGEAKTVTFNLTRRDISNWDVVSQNWVVTPHKKMVHVGASSRDFRLEGELPLAA
ncbi:hypothetical protein DL770_007599 [Monosporascus sp. CRB-9-2]|nr:hypothetical protein DL770_007599 [Monosporascus sp. CRB-9-2]